MRRDVPVAAQQPAGAISTVAHDEWTLRLPFERPLSLNARQHHYAKAREVAEWVDAVLWLAKGARIPSCQRILVELHWIPGTNRRRDPDNPVAAYKPCVDALVRAHVVVDDTLEYVERVFPVIHPSDPKRRPNDRVFLRIVKLA